MERQPFRVIAGIGGIAFGLLLLAGGFLPGPPPNIGSNGTEVVAFYRQHGGAQQLGNFLIGLSTLGFFLLLPGLWTILRRLEGEAGFVTIAAPSAGIAAAALGLAGTAAFQALALAADGVQDPNVVALVEIFARMTRNFTYFPQALLIGLSSWVFLRAEGGVRWLGRAGMVVSALLLLGTLILFTSAPVIRAIDLIALIGFGLWYVALGATLIAKVDLLVSGKSG